jgi:methyl halide transferase
MGFDSNYWQVRYEQNQTQWDVGAITPPLREYILQLKNKDITILIPGCGQAYEAEYLFRSGFKNVYVADLASFPLESFKQRVPEFPEDQLLHQDFFSLKGEYDLLLEQTFFCALPPELRLAYASKAAQLLRPGGKLVGVLFETVFEQPGPPFGGTREEYRHYFDPWFEFKVFERCHNSIGPRKGRELFILLEKKQEQDQFI